METAGFTLDLYCDTETDNQHYNDQAKGYDRHGQFVGQTYAECKRAARSQGWIYIRGDTHVCPRHSGKGKL